MRRRYRTRIFLATFSGAVVVLLLASTLIAVSLRRQTYDRIERGLINEARLAAELLSHHTRSTTAVELEEEARALASDIDARVTLIAADGRVIGDSSQDEEGVARLENHGSRPEVVDARERGIGVSTRFSATLGIDMLYVAARVGHPSVAVIRLALPLTEIDRQLRTIWRATLYSLALSLVGAFAMAAVASALLARRLNRLAAAAQRYADGEPPPAAATHDDDEIGTVARVLDDAVRQLAGRAAEIARDRARMEAILAGMAEGVLVIDRQGRVQLLNASARRMLQTAGEPAGRHYLECVRQPAVVSQLEAVNAGTAADALEPAVIREAGRVLVARAARVAGAAGAADEGGAVLVLHDITDLDRVDQIRRDFVANVSHELRTPLTAIRGYVEALQDEPPSESDRQKFLEIIGRHTSRMERLARDLLRLARLEAGQDAPEYSSCSVQDLFAGVIADLQAKLEARRQRAAFDVDPGCELFVTDPVLVHEALQNVVENASIYSPEGGTIVLGARREGDRVLLTVSDDGPGIPPAALSRVFERFYRVDKARSRDSGGTGLGLAIVKHIIERLDGTVRAGNRPGGGAVFTLGLPCRPATVAPVR